MPQPTPYTRSYSFSDYQENFSDQPLPGSQVDINLDAVELSIGQICTRLAIIQRDDGALNNNVVTSDSFAASALALISGFTPRGNWASATAYAVGDLVNNGGFIYVCHTAHTSAGSFATTNWNSWAVSGSASGITFTPAGSIAAVNVQAALEELDSEKQASGFFMKQAGTAIASGATTNLGAADSDFVHITGTTTITSLGATTTRNHVWVEFDAALTLTHNGTSLILPTAANITTAAGDVAEFVRVSGSNWKCLNYYRYTGQPLLVTANQEADSAPASGTVTLNMNLGQYRKVSPTGNFTIDITPITGKPASYVLQLVNGGAYTITWTGVDDWADGIAPTLTSSGTDLIGFIADDDGNVRGYLIGAAFA